MAESLHKTFSVDIEKASSFQKHTLKKSKQSFEDIIMAVSLGRTTKRSRSKLEVKKSEEPTIIKSKQNPKNGKRVAQNNDIGECLDNDQIFDRNNATEKDAIEAQCDRTISSASKCPLLVMDNITSKTSKVEESADVTTRNKKRVKILLSQGKSFLELCDSRERKRKMRKNSPITDSIRSNTDEQQDFKNDIPRKKNLQSGSPDYNENKSQELHNSSPSRNSRKYKNEPIFNLLTNPSVLMYSMENLCMLSSQEMSYRIINEQREKVCKDNKCKVEKLGNIAEKKGEAEPLESTSQTKSILVSKLIKHNCEESKEMVDELLNHRLQGRNEGMNDNLKAKKSSMEDFIPKFEEKRVAYDKHSVMTASLSFEDLEQHFNEITTDLTAIYSGKIQCTRHDLYLKNDATFKNLHSLGPFTSMQSQLLIEYVYKFLFPGGDTCVESAEYVNYVMLPETCIRIYSRVTGLDYERAEQEMRFGPYYD